MSTFARILLAVTLSNAMIDRAVERFIEKGKENGITAIERKASMSTMKEGDGCSRVEPHQEKVERTGANAAHINRSP